MDTTPTYSAREQRLLTVVPAAMFLLVAFATLAVLAGTYAIQAFRPSTPSASAATATTRHIALDILPVKPGGPAENWPAYMPSTSMSVPANTIITVTIRNFDLGDAALAANSPLAKVQGTADGTASFNGSAYTGLDAAKVSHTFTIPQIGLNVPIPGDAPNANDTYLTVTFSFRTPKAGTYTFQCFAPCGTGDTGFNGPMASMAYMKGTLTVRG